MIPGRNGYRMDHVGLLMRLDLLSFQAQLVDVGVVQLFPVSAKLTSDRQNYLT